MKLREIPPARIGTRLGYLRNQAPPTRKVTGSKWFREPLTVIPSSPQRSSPEAAYEFVDGFKRLTALKAAGYETIPCVVQSWDVTRAKAMILLLNCRRNTVSFFEEALLVQDLHEKEGLSLAKIGRLLGRRKGWVSKRLSLIKRLDPEIRPFLQQGHLGPRAGYQISRLPRDLQMTVFVSSRSRKLTVSETESIVSMILALPQEDRLTAAREPRSLLSSREVAGVSPEKPPPAGKAGASGSYRGGHGGAAEAA